jgi:membrane carboxypeptidase/penicillin-binding protein
VGLSGSQAALPIWTDFMKRALAGRSSVSFRVPEGISFVDIDRDSGQLATPQCAEVMSEAFATGTEPVDFCMLHQ